MFLNKKFILEPSLLSNVVKISMCSIRIMEQIIILVKSYANTPLEHLIWFLL
jgi:hypothetical protein